MNSKTPLFFFRKIITFNQFSLLFLLFFSIVCSAQENCNNGIDDDGDGKIDLNDPDCICNSSAVSSIIPNPSLETHSSCPSEFSQLNYATPWIQATIATTDYYNTCGFIAPGIISSGLQNFPYGNGIAAAIYDPEWNEYMGATLLSPMLAGTNYQLTFNIAALKIYGNGNLSTDTDINDLEPVNVTLYGCANGANLPLNTTFNPNSYDPTWVEIGHAIYTPASLWGELTISFTPSINVNAIMLGSPPVLPPSYANGIDYPYFLYDNLLLNTASSFGVNITQTGNFCDNNLILNAQLTTTVSPAATYQWYRDGIAIVGATNATYNVAAFSTNLGVYSVKITDGTTCLISTKKTINNLVASPGFTVTQPTCIIPTGSITITTAGSEFSFDNGITWQTSSTLSGLPVGNYYVKIKTPSGCMSSGAGVNIIEPQLLAGSNIDVVQPATCDGTGSITVNSSNAVQYSFDDGLTWTTNSTANNLQPGTYLVKIKDAIGCQSGSQYVLLNRIYLDNPLYNQTQPGCGIGGTISINTSASEYSFDDGVTWTTSAVATGLEPGTYGIKIRNAAGCESYSQYVYLNPFYLNIIPTYTTIQPTCGTGGSITITTPATEYSFDNGTTWTTNPTATNLIPNTYYIQIKNDLGCVSYSQYVNLSPFYLPDPTFTVVQPSCGTGGSITITTPASEYSFDGGVTWSANATSSNLNPGSYLIMIKSSLGCTSNYQYVNLDYFYLPDPTFIAVNPSCGNIGSITITTPDVQCSFDGGITWTTNPVNNNLPSGYYYIKVKNALGCESNYVYIYLDSNSLANPNFTVVQPGCGTTGNITITTVADKYSFDGGMTWVTNPVKNNLSPGYYYIMIKNSAGCTSGYQPVSLETYYLPDPAFTIVQPTCGTKGIITITTPADQYSFDGGITWSTNPVKNNLDPSYYYIMIKNSAGCTSGGYQYAYINSFYLPDPTFTVTPPGCGVGAIITINSIADQYSFDGGITWSTNPVKNNVTTGYYNIMVKSNLGCTSNSGQYIYIEEFHLPDPFYTVVQPSCGAGGSITITTTADKYSFDGGITWSTNPVKNNLPPGYYNVMIKNSAGCTSSANQYLNLNEFYLPTPVYTVIQPVCGIGGTITINSPADQYSFDNGQTWTTNPVAINLPPNTYYYLMIKNNMGCTSYSNYVYLYSSSTVPITPTVTKIQPSSCAATDGSITVTSYGPYYSFNNGVTWTTNSSINSLGNGTYLIRVKESSNGCVSPAATVVLNGSSNTIPPPDFTVVQPTCSASGSITITTSGTAYSFDNGVSWSTNNILSNLNSGSYSLKIKINGGCISSANTVNITPVTIPSTPNYTVVQPLCGAEGSITISTSASQYSFDNGVTWTTNNIASNLAAGTYNIQIKNNSCPSVALPIVIDTPVNSPEQPTISILQPTTCIAPFGSITITSPAALYSFDNGITYTINPVSGNLASGTYNIKVKNSAGCISPVLSVTINVPPDFPTDPTFLITQPDCTNSKGMITITSSASEYSFNNGASWSIAPMSSYLNPGTYSIKVKNALGCISNASIAVIIPYTGVTPTPISTSPQIFCFQEIKTLTDIVISGQNIKWFDALTGGNLLPDSTLLLDNITYYASQSLGPCESARIPILVNFQNTPAPTGDASQSYCIHSNPTLNNINVSGSDIKWYDIAGNLLPTTTPLVDNTVYYSSQTIYGCESLTRTSVTITLIDSLPAFDYDTLICDELNDGTERINLSDYNNNLIASLPGYSFSYYTSFSGADTQLASEQLTDFANHNLFLGTNSIYVRINSNTVCYAVVELKLTLLAKPIVSIADIVPICEGKSAILTADSGFDSYLWSNGATTKEITVNLPGEYNVTVTQNHGSFVCSTTKVVQVVASNIATITNIETTDWTDSDNIISVYANGLGSYEYSLDGINYQDSNVFSGLRSGLYTVYVKDKYGCGIAIDDVYLLTYPKFFTPNGDTFNDTWNIKLSGMEPNLSVVIFDRYGKFLKNLISNGPGWDGTYNGHEMPSTDYWFVVTRENGKEYRGHFSLKR